MKLGRLRKLISEGIFDDANYEDHPILSRLLDKDDIYIMGDQYFGRGADGSEV